MNTKLFEIDINDDVTKLINEVNIWIKANKKKYQVIKTTFGTLYNKKDKKYMRTVTVWYKYLDEKEYDEYIKKSENKNKKKKEKKNNKTKVENKE